MRRARAEAARVVVLRKVRREAEVGLAGLGLMGRVSSFEGTI